MCCAVVLGILCLEKVLMVILKFINSLNNCLKKFQVC